jgi:hypothetical protein
MPTDDEKKKKTFNLQNTPQSFEDLGPDGPEGMGAGTMAVTPRQPSSAGASALAEANSVANDPELRSAYMEQSRTTTELNKEALRSRKFENENAGRDPKRERLTPLRTIEARERAAQRRESQAAAEAQRKEDFWNQGKATERPEARAARDARQQDFQQRQDSQRDRMNAALAPIREAAFARQAAEKQRQEDMKDPAKRLAAMRMRAAELGATINYAEVGGPDGKKATYMRPTKEGTEGYLATRGNKNLQDMANKAQGAGGGLVKDRAGNLQGADRDLANQNGNLLAARPSPSLPQNMTAPASQAGIDRATNAMAAATPKPATPDMVTPTFINAPIPKAPERNLVAGTDLERTFSPAQADPNAAAAIASFNQMTGAQAANKRNLQRGDNVPTIANVPGELAGRYGKAFMNSPGMNIVTGKALAGKPLITPRRRTQTAQPQSQENPLLARR